AAAGELFRARKFRIRLLRIACCLLLGCYFLLSISAAEPDKLSVYASQARYSIPILSLDGRQYVGILELIGPLGTPELKSEGKKWKLRVPDPKVAGKFADAEFEEGSATVRVRGRQTTLSSPVRSENRHLLVPVHGIGTILIPLLGTDVTFHEAAHRLFLAGTATAISSELRKGDPSILALHFAEAVSPNIHSEGNALILSFTQDPVVSFTEYEALNDKLFSSSAYEEKNGTASLTITGNAPLLAKFADNGRTILVSAAPPPPEVTTTALPPSTPVTQSPPEQAVQTPSMPESTVQGPGPPA